ncbi:MAG: deoxyribodipyrimidine photo-lyase [Thermodesulfobacteriota bacterium]|nr:deoxyribodipyrimidine photo-lyase [Thermodesulfobacteriota bacterium]
MTPVSEFRISNCNKSPMNNAGKYVLYWMIAHRRTKSNFSLQRAVEWSVALKKPLVILEALRCDYPWASDRLHRFVMQGMRDSQLICHESKALYYPYLEQTRHEGRGLIRAMSSHACVIVTDDFPCFFLPKMVASAANQVTVLMEKVDSNGLLPITWADHAFTRAFDFRRFLQRNLEPHLFSFPEPDPLQHLESPATNALLSHVQDHWPPSHSLIEDADQTDLSLFPIDHSVRSSCIRGGQRAAATTLNTFLKESLHKYDESRNHPDDDATSGLSPYLHFGHISAHQVFAELTKRESWAHKSLSASTSGKREGWWGMSKNAEAFLDELITWRELGYNMCRHRPDYDRYESLPGWAQQTLFEHADDQREYVYTPQQLEDAETHDEIWNCAQKQLRTEGKVQNYLRMLWGKNILTWSKLPKDALDIMIHLNNKYALDGRNPNSYSGIFWILGRYDRPWGPERPVFGKVRYMSSESTRRKLRISGYLKKYKS